MLPIINKKSTLTLQLNPSSACFPTLKESTSNGISTGKLRMLTNVKLFSALAAMALIRVSIVEKPQEERKSKNKNMSWFCTGFPTNQLKKNNVKTEINNKKTKLYISFAVINK